MNAGTIWPLAPDAAEASIPTWSRTRTWTFGRSYAIHYTTGTTRADDWIRTSMIPLTGRAPFSVEPRRLLSRVSGGNRTQRPDLHRVVCEDHYTTDTILRAVSGQPACQSMNATCRMATACVSVFISKSQRKGRESNSQGTHVLDRLPTGSRHRSGCPPVVGLLLTRFRLSCQPTPRPGIEPGTPR